MPDRQAPCWIVEQQKPVVRGSIDLGTQPVMEWRPQLGYGYHSSRLSAMRAYIEAGDPDYCSASDRIIRGHWRCIARSSQLRTAHFVQSPNDSLD
jgi:hypothetical protein